MTKPSQKYSWQPLRALHAQQERRAQEQLASAEAQLILVRASLDRAKAAAADWHDRGMEAVRQHRSNRKVAMCEAAELQSVADYNYRCLVRRETYRLRICMAEKRAHNMAEQVERLREELRAAHATRSATDQHYQRWANQVRRASELATELEQEDLYLVQHSLRSNGAVKS